MLKKFENTDIIAKDPECYEYFKKISDFADVENVFNKAVDIAGGIEKIGLSIVRENELTAVGITLSDTEIYYIRYRVCYRELSCRPSVRCCKRGLTEI